MVKLRKKSIYRNRNGTAPNRKFLPFKF